MGRNLRGRRDQAAQRVTQGKHEAQLVVSWGGAKSYTCILVRNDFDALDMASRLEDLPQHIFGDARVQASHIQGPFVRLRSGATRDVTGTATGWRHDIGAHGGADCSGNGVVVLGDDDGRKRRGHVLLLLALVAAIVTRRAGRGRGLSARGSRIGHCD